MEQKTRVFVRLMSKNSISGPHSSLRNMERAECLVEVASVEWTQTNPYISEDGAEADRQVEVRSVVWTGPLFYLEKGEAARQVVV
jgi:hypothetical protein